MTVAVVLEVRGRCGVWGAVGLRTCQGGGVGDWPPPATSRQVIYMARNPKDLVVSYYQFHRSLRTMSYRGTFQEFCRRFMNDKRKCRPHRRPPAALAVP